MSRVWDNIIAVIISLIVGFIIGKPVWQKVINSIKESSEALKAILDAVDESGPEGPKITADEWQAIKKEVGDIVNVWKK
ncbi:MAG: hypothetical protein ABIH92_00850 [Nanoarchaeota archaeon]